MNFETWWKNSGPGTYGQKMIAEQAWEAAVSFEREACALECEELRSESTVSQYVTSMDCATARRAMEECGRVIRMRSNVL